MSEQDALSNFDWSAVTKPSIYLKFEVDKPLTLRVLTTDPVVFTSEFEDKKTGEVNVTTKFAFIIYNFTEDKAQILQATGAVAKKIGELHVDPDFGANIKNIDIKISPTTGSNGFRQYDIQVLPQARTLTDAQIKEAQMINLDEKIDGGGRMSFYKPEEEKVIEVDTVVTEIPDKIDLKDIPF
jgi:hypothetical protein